MPFTYSGTFVYNGVGTNGATVEAYRADRFVTPPGFNEGRPTGAPDATSVTGPQAGYPGAFDIELPDDELYQIVIEYQTERFWLGPVGAIEGPAGPPGAAGPQGPTGPAGEWVEMTAADYAALPTKDPDTLYVIVN